MTFPYSNSHCSLKNVLELMLISTSAVTFQKAGGQVSYFCDVTGKQTVLKQGCYVTKTLTNEQTGTAQNKHFVISRYLSPKTSWGFTKAKPPWLPGRRKCPGCVLLECTVITREEEGLRLSLAGTFPSKVWGLDAGQTSSFQSLCMQWLSSGFPSDAQSPLFSYRLFIHD